jgi:hypothetical protein
MHTFRFGIAVAAALFALPVNAQASKLGPASSCMHRELTMCFRIAWLALVFAIPLSTHVVPAQTLGAPLSAGEQTFVTSGGSELAGKWTYRSFHNNPALVYEDEKTAPEKALKLIFAEAVFTFADPSART